jgi:phenylalanyl-tRNA synthetase beta chain
MLVSYNWLQEYFDEKLPEPEDLGNILTFHAFEIESLEKVGDDYAIDIDVLPNRSSDALSHRGIAREIATLLNRNLKYDPLDGETLEVEDSEKVQVEIEDKKLCARYAISVIEGVKVGPSPKWLKTYLEAVGQRSINNIVDATNYVMLNTGQPLHAFDMDKLDGENKKILIRCAKEGEEIITLTDDKYELDKETLLIVDANSDKPIGIAGVKVVKAAEVDENTKSIIIESANFSRKSVRKTSQRLKLWTDASTRFQNNPSALLVGYALADVTELILDIAGGSVEGGKDMGDDFGEEKSAVDVSLSQINNLLGTKLSAEDVEAILNRFDFDFGKEGEVFTVTPPFERTDINIYEDLIEEVGRVYGYEHLEAKDLPPISSNPEIDKEYAYTDKVINILNNEGYSEIMGYTFRDKGDYEALSAFASDKSHLRTNLSDGMKEYLEKNVKNAPLFGLERIKQFEIGRVFPKSGERVSLAIAISGNKADKILDEAKLTLEKTLNVKVKESPKDGILEINFSQLIEDLPNLSSYEKFERNFTLYKDFSLYPFVLRDIAVWVPNTTEEKEILDILEKNSDELLVRVTKFDEFKKDDKTSYGYHLVFQAKERTLTDVEIGGIMDKITSDLNRIKGFEVR